MAAFQPQERAKAISEGKSKYFTGRPCKYGHVAERRVNGGACTVCEAERHNKWKAENPDKMQTALIKYREANREALNQKAAERRANDPEKARKSYRESKRRNRGHHTMLQSMRDKRIRLATPSWLTKEHKEWIKSIYAESHRIKCDGGIDTAVDHIIPIKGKDVCGLHVPWNLRVTSKQYNSHKTNNTDHYLPEYQSVGTIMIHKSAITWMN